MGNGFYKSLFVVFGLLTLFLVQVVSAAGYANPALVNLGTAGDFVVLGQSGVTATGIATTHITGDVGLYPAAASTQLTGFGGGGVGGMGVMDPSNTFSLSNPTSLVAGNIYGTGAPWDPAPTAKLLAATSDLVTAEGNVYARTRGPTEGEDLNGAGSTTGGTSELGGHTFTRGVYRWPTGAQTTTISTDMTLSGAADDIFIFEIAGPFDIHAKVNLIGGAQAKNVYWAVAGQTTIYGSGDISGNILDQTGIAMQNGAKLTGRALAQTAVTIDGNAISLPAGTSGSGNNNGQQGQSGGLPAPSLSLSVVPNCSGNIVTVVGRNPDSGPVAGALIVVNDERAVGMTNSSGQMNFSGCGDSAAIYAHAIGYVSTGTKDVKLISCSICGAQIKCPNGVVLGNECIAAPIPYVCLAPNCCIDNAQCANSETCVTPTGAAGTANVTGSCKQVTGQCGQAQDHKFVKYECGPDPVCNSCASSQSCENNICVILGVNCPHASGMVGTNMTCQLTRDNQACKDCSATIIAPSGTERTVVSADASGQIQIRLIQEGNYKILNGPNYGYVVATPGTLETPATTSTKAAPAGFDYLWLISLLLLLLIGIGIGYWYATKKHKKKQSEN